MVDDSRKAYIGKIEGNICAQYPIQDKLNTVKDLPQVLGTKDSLHLCIPVERKQHETNPPVSKPSRRSRVESISDTQGSTSKRPRSGTRTSKKEVNTKVKIKVKKEVKKEVKQEVEVEYSSEVNVDLEVDSKDNQEAKQEDILGSVDANNRLLDKDIVSDINDLKEELKEQGKEGLSRKRQAKKPARYMVQEYSFIIYYKINDLPMVKVLFFGVFSGF